MADFPQLLQRYGSTQTDTGGFKVGRTVSGRLKLRSFFTTDVRTFAIILDEEDAGKAQVESHYAGDRKNEFNFFWSADQQTYTVRYLRPPQYKIIPGDRWEIRVLLEVV